MGMGAIKRERGKEEHDGGQVNDERPDVSQGDFSVCPLIIRKVC